MDITFVKVRADGIHVDCYSSSGNYEISIHPCTAGPISTAMIQGNRIVIQGTNGRTDIYDIDSANYLMSV